jgi:hypothetical protein
MNDQGYRAAPADSSPADVERRPAEETIVADARAGLTPSRMVERKLLALLGDGQLPVSWLQTPRPRDPLA